MFQKVKTREEKIDKFLDTLTWFHSEKSTPTGLYATIGRIEENLRNFNNIAENFIKTVDRASKSSESLTKALNKITLAGVLVAVASIIVAIISLIFEIYKFSISR